MVTLEHPELGLVQLRTRRSARRMTIKVAPKLVIITIPVGFDLVNGRQSTVNGSHSDLTFLSQEMVERILRLREKVVSRSGVGRFGVEDEIETLTFRVVIGWQENQRVRAYGAQLVDGVLRISMPVGVDIEMDVVQKTLKRIVLKFLRAEAERVLPERLERWSKRCGLGYRSVKVDTAKSRWGCCSSHKDIKLSYYLLLLPERLVDYVIVHELCHTCEMNHGPRFKALLHNYFNDYAAIELAKPKWDRKVSWLKL